MSKVAADTIKSLLPGLQEHELQEIMGRGSILLSSSSSARPLISNSGSGGSGEEEAFYQACYILLRKKKRQPPEWHQFIRTRGNKVKFDEGFKHVHNFLLDFIPNITKMEKREMYRRVAKAIIDYLNARREPLGMVNITEYLQFVPDMMDEAYPGYLECDMGRAILRKRS